MNCISDYDFALVNTTLRGILRARGDESEMRSELNILCRALLGLPASALTLFPERCLTREQAERLTTILPRLKTGEPLAYILGQTDFCFLRIACRPGVLIPRGNTELLAETGIRHLPENGRILDLCCGTGCVGLALAAAGAAVVCADISEEALALTRENAALNGLTVRTVKSDLFSALNGERFNLILCNPPYIASGDIEKLDRSVRDFEPKLALDGGNDGLAFYRKLKQEAFAHLTPGGKLLVEHGYDQGEAVRRLFGEENTTTLRDNGGHERVAVITQGEI